MTPEQEIKLLKELLYCTKRSCNNCGKVNCENFQRQRIDCCGLWVSYKDYIKQQEEKIADLKANFDYVIEGKDLEIKELKDKLQACKYAMAMSEKVEKQLREENVKAKDLIEDMYDKIPSSHSDYYKDVMERTRQFLKEIGK